MVLAEDTGNAHPDHWQERKFTDGYVMSHKDISFPIAVRVHEI